MKKTTKKPTANNNNHASGCESFQGIPKPQMLIKWKTFLSFRHYLVALRILSTSDVAQLIHQEPGY